MKTVEEQLRIMIPRRSPFKKLLVLKKRKKFEESCGILSVVKLVTFVFIFIDVINGIVFSVFHHVLQFPLSQIVAPKE